MPRGEASKWMEPNRKVENNWPAIEGATSQQRRTSLDHSAKYEVQKITVEPWLKTEGGVSTLCLHIRLGILVDLLMEETASSWKPLKIRRPLSMPF